MTAPGQTTNVLLTANQIPDTSGVFLIAARPYVTSISFDNSTTFGFLKYKSRRTEKIKPLKIPRNFVLHNLPEMRDTDFASEFSNKLRSLASPQYPCNVKIDKRVMSFVRPTISMLESHYKNLDTLEYSLVFPENPPNPFNYTGIDPVTENMNTEVGTKVLSVPYGTNLEILMQGTSFLNVENHPIHVHGHNFFIVGMRFGNYNADKDPANYNLIDPPERNTVAVPTGGWAAIRFKADNPCLVHSLPS
ncbi:Laccase [Quillaja saponaria]|uniref:Laccase n=1 Tax=Quillaja saponaria TaxID=32244 RepID=A0AAD7M7Z7_QUISA|nr:Laccase [Quillaja saponaria]